MWIKSLIHALLALQKFTERWSNSAHKWNCNVSADNHPKIDTNEWAVSKFVGVDIG